MPPVKITRIEGRAYRVPIVNPVRTSFGTMRDRPAVFVRIEDQHGHFGWGEVFCNWPSAGAEHRVRVMMEDMADLILGAELADAQTLYNKLSRETRIRALQCGEPGPFAQVTSGLDVAAHDLFARRAGLPLRKLLNPNAPDFVPAYASGIQVDHAERVLPDLRSRGIKAHKVKVGFDAERDISLVCELLVDRRKGERLFADANQKWTVPEALNFMRGVAGRGLVWIEEPIPADNPPEDWKTLADAGLVPIAAGENITGLQDFAATLDAGFLDFIQPDVAKWGGITGAMAISAMAKRTGATFCMHFLGGGVGLAASAECLAASGSDGLLEVDVNFNPLRDAFGGMDRIDVNGNYRMENHLGLGIDDIPAELEKFGTLRLQKGL